MTLHNQSNMQMSITNDGQFGFATIYWSTKTKDPFSGERLATVHYPRGSDIAYQMNGTLILGAVVDGDTLVSTGGAEFYPEEGTLGDFRYRSIDVNHPRYDLEANSQLDIICEYLDTFPVYASPDLRPHKPLGVKIIQKSMSWTGDNIDDFILFDFEIHNIGENHLENMYVGFQAHGGVNYTGDFNTTLTQYDDVVGFIHTATATAGCEYLDTFNLAYQMDFDGDPVGNTWEYYSPRGVVGMRILGVPAWTWQTNFNWSSEQGFRGPRFSPRLRPSIDRPYKDYLPHLSEGLKDVEWFYYLSNPVVDYDQLWAAVDHTGSGWLPAPSDIDRYILHSRPYYIISAGPFDMMPGQVQSVALAVVGGMDVHVNPYDFRTTYSLRDPTEFYKTLDFLNFANNARWANWVYDNPGVDTDGNGYSGRWRSCEGRPFFPYVGDGVADYRADGPPQSPPLQVIPSAGRLTIRWNGYYSETVPDPFTNLLDFEGYRVFVGLDDRVSSLSLLSSFDRENYDRFRWTLEMDGNYYWINEDNPFTLESLRQLYHNPEFDPRNYTRLNPLEMNDTLYAFEPHSYNASSLCCMDGIHKKYPNATDPGTDTSLWTEDDVIYDYGEALPKYYEYEFVYDKILPTIPYWVAVTAFDFGFAAGNIPSKESNPLNNLATELAQTPADTVEKYDLDAYVYPNPWRWDGYYSKSGYENRDRTEIPGRSHRIHFGNLPRVCKISIYSLDGDLIRVIDHDYPEGASGSMHDYWDMITRNTQAVESGLYYYVIESENRTQLGKFVIIK